MKTEDIIRIENFFQEYIYGFMFNDINSAITGKANFLAALGLIEYTEILGGFIVPKTKGEDKFNEFIPYLGESYVEINKELKKDGGLYGRVRCGLAHEYFIKGSSTIWMASEKPLNCGIILDEVKEDWVHFVVAKYFEDFKSAVDIYHAQLVDEKNEDLIKKFLAATR